MPSSPSVSYFLVNGLRSCWMLHWLDTMSTSESFEHVLSSNPSSCLSSWFSCQPLHRSAWMILPTLYSLRSGLRSGSWQPGSCPKTTCTTQQKSSVHYPDTRRNHSLNSVSTLFHSSTTSTGECLERQGVRNDRWYPCWRIEWFSLWSLVPRKPSRERTDGWMQEDGDGDSMFSADHYDE
jgi:hypothetical protein